MERSLLQCSIPYSKTGRNAGVCSTTYLVLMADILWLAGTRAREETEAFAAPLTPFEQE